MPKTKTLLILANSIKHWPSVCIAGREIKPGGERYSFGPWIRPVSSHGEGELSPTDCQLSNGSQLCTHMLYTPLVIQIDQ